MAVVNPLQYRGYYHDSETGFYYLQSRYYDPEICRFINADSYASTGQSYLGYNTFAYCGNDPVNRTDADGEFWDTASVLRMSSRIRLTPGPRPDWSAMLLTSFRLLPVSERSQRPQVLLQMLQMLLMMSTIRQRR